MSFVVARSVANLYGCKPNLKINKLLGGRPHNRNNSCNFGVV